MRVLQPEPFEADLGVAVGHVVVVPVGVEQQVGRVQDPDAAPAPGAGGGDVQAVEEGLVPVERAVAVGVLVDRDPVQPPDVVRRRRRDLVVDDPPDAVAAEHLQAGRLGILAVLDDPEPPPLVEVEEDRLRDLGLGEDQVDPQVLRDPESLQGLGRRQRAVGRPGRHRGHDDPEEPREPSKATGETGLHRRRPLPSIEVVAGPIRRRSIVSPGPMEGNGRLEGRERAGRLQNSGDRAG